MNYFDLVDYPDFAEIADAATDDGAVRELADRYGARVAKLPPVAVVLAAYDEEGVVGAAVTALPRTICGLPAEVIVIADGCVDSTAKEAHEAGAIVADVPVNRGQGAALRLGYRVARDGGAKYIVTTDADGQYDPQEIESLLAPVVAGEADFVTGARRSPGRAVRFFARLVSRLSGHRVTDASFGLRAMRAEVTGVVRLEEPRYHAAELLIGVIARGYRVAEVPASFRWRMGGQSKPTRHPLSWLDIAFLDSCFHGLCLTRIIVRTWWRER